MTIMLTARSAALHALYAEIERATNGRVPAGMHISGEWLVVPAAHSGGYDIYASPVGGEFRVDFGGLHAEFVTLDETASWIARAASGEYRLRVEYRGASPVEWVLERAGAAASGEPLSPTLASGNVVLLSRLRRKHSVCLSNAA